MFFRAFPNAIFARRSFSEVGKNCNLHPPPLWAKLQTAEGSRKTLLGAASEAKPYETAHQDVSILRAIGDNLWTTQEFSPVTLLVVGQSSFTDEILTLYGKPSRPDS